MTSAGERQVEVPAWVRAQPGRTIVALPAYNEEDALPRLLRRVHEAMVDARLEYEIIVVDDGSTDETPMILQQHARFLPLTTVTHERNAGLSQTIFDALQAALQRATPRDVIVSMDADDTHAPGVILRMVRMVREGYQVVIASRYREGSVVRGVPFGRRAMSRLASLTSRLFAPIPGVRDYTCGYRAYDAGFLKSVWRPDAEFARMAGFECMLEILLSLHRAGAVMGEVPFVLRYDLKSGQSKMRVGRTALGALRLLFRHRFSGRGKAGSQPEDAEHDGIRSPALRGSAR